MPIRAGTHIVRVIPLTNATTAVLPSVKRLIIGSVVSIAVAPPGAIAQ